MNSIAPLAIVVTDGVVGLLLLVLIILGIIYLIRRA